MFHDRRRILINQGVATMTIETTSTSASWGVNVTNGNSSAIWEVTGGVTIAPFELVGNSDPVLDLSGNTGTAIVTAKGFDNMTAVQSRFSDITSVNVFDLIDATDIDFNNNLLTTIDVSKNTNLLTLIVGVNQLTSINVTNNVNLEALFINSNNITTIDTSSNPLLFRLDVHNNNLTDLDISNNPLINFIQFYGNSIPPTVTDSVLDTLDSNGISNGTAYIPNNRTSASDTDYNSLIAKGWTIIEI